jgi:UDP-N-acetylglucosamine diphosphorylase/glucosamine-1-phosphate N-acetyltransferase
MDIDIDALYPFTWTRPVTAIRLGILTLAEKWQRLLPGGKPAALPDNIVPDQALARLILAELASDASAPSPHDPSRPLSPQSLSRILAAAQILEYPWQIVEFNASALADDFDLLTRNRDSQPIPPSVQTINPSQIFIEEGANLQYCILNASTGPIYIGHNTTIMEGSMIRGPFAACEGTVVKMGAMIYGATTLGPHCTAGGEIKNSVLFGYSNKGHDGYLGDSVIGEWCNLGAGTSNSNLKNNAGAVKVWHQASAAFIPAGIKCGLLMGDYSRAAINTSFNTGTVVGPSSNIFGEGLTPTHIPAFTWGYGAATSRYRLETALRDIGSWKKLKNQVLNDTEIRTLKTIFDKIFNA